MIGNACVRTHVVDTETKTSSLTAQIKILGIFESWTQDWLDKIIDFTTGLLCARTVVRVHRFIDGGNCTGNQLLGRITSLSLSRRFCSTWALSFCYIVLHVCVLTLFWLFSETRKHALPWYSWLLMMVSFTFAFSLPTPSRFRTRQRVWEAGLPPTTRGNPWVAAPGSDRPGNAGMLSLRYWWPFHH